jgi:hypothetical protein
VEESDALAAVSIDELRQLARVDRTTALRWKRGQSRVPQAVLTLLRLYVDGDAAALLGDAWRGWRFGRDGLLYAPGWRRGFSPAEVLTLPYLHGQLAALKREKVEAAQARRLDHHHTRRARPPRAAV